MKELLTNILKNATYVVGDSKIQDIVNQALASISSKSITFRPSETTAKSQREKCRHYNKMPHHPLPNSVEYTRENSNYEMVSALFGIIRRENKGKENITNWTNYKANRYVRYYMNYLGHLRDKGHASSY